MYDGSERLVRRIAVIIATIGFFVLAGVGTATGVPPFVCAMRAVVGAVALFAVVMVGGRLALTIVVDAFMSSALRRQDPRNKPHEYRG